VNGSLVTNPGAQATTSAPPAIRVRRPGWRDPRLWIGVLIVAVSVLAGARVLASADDTVGVWAVAADAGPGARINPDDLVVHRVRFADGADLGGYYRVDDQLPSDLRLVHGVGAGELLPRAAVGSAADSGDLVELPVAVEPDQVPGSVRSGSIVDVYLVGSGPQRGSDGPVLTEATVVDSPDPESSFGAVDRRQLVLAVRQGDARHYFRSVQRIDAPQLTVVRRG
jgi:hypothetical protein